MMTRFIKVAACVGAAYFLLGVPTGVRAQQLTDDLQGLLQGPFQPQPLWVASTDPKHQNLDYVLLKPGEKRRIPLDKGTLLRLWSTSKFPDQTTLLLQTSRDRVKPLWDKNKALSGALQGKAYTLYPIFDYEALSKLSDGAALIVTNHAKEDSKWYFQALVRPDKPTNLPILPQVTQIDRKEVNVVLPKNSEREFGTWPSPGLIYELEVAMDQGSANGIFSQLRLRASFDGQRAIDAPLMALAGQQRGDEFGPNAVADYDGLRLKLRWPMPFKNAKMSLYNPTDKDLKLDVTARFQSFADEPSKVRFCATEQSARTEQGKPISILKVKGQGALAGLALSIEPDKGSPKQTFAYLEGNETITLDGAPYEGTGNEDYFSSAWYFPEKPYLSDYSGLSFKSAKPPAISAYRFHVVDPLPFKKSLDFSFEQGRGNNTDDLNWKWTAMWYQIPPLSVPGAQGGDAPNGVTASTPDAVVGGGLPNGVKIGLAIIAGIAIGVFSAMRKIKRKKS